MRVDDLIRVLEEYPPHLRVVLSKDAEGNHFSPLSECSHGIFVEDTTWSGEFRSSLSDEDDEDGRPMAVKDADALCLWPVN